MRLVRRVLSRRHTLHPWRALPSSRALCTGREGKVETWPDGTPKKFQGKDSWKNWIDWDSPYRELTDELNRARHFFWYVDAKGRLFRREIDQPGTCMGQMRDARVLDYFWGHMQRNHTGLYGEWPHVSCRMHEKYFVQCQESPIVFNDWRDGELRHMCPGGEIAKSVSTPFDPALMRLSSSGKLYHPVTSKAVGKDGTREVIMALIESTTVQEVLRGVVESDSSPSGSTSNMRDASSRLMFWMS